MGFQGPDSLLRSIPTQCTPTGPILSWISSTFATCVPTTPGLFSVFFGICSVVFGSLGPLPQIHTNYRFKHTRGLSVSFPISLLVGDCMNLVGAVFTKQTTWQIALEVCFVAIDSTLICQYVWYDVWNRTGGFRRMKNDVLEPAERTSLCRGTAGVDEDEEDSVIRMGDSRPDSETTPLLESHMRKPVAGSSKPASAGGRESSRLRYLLSFLHLSSVKASELPERPIARNNPHVLVGRVLSWPAHLFFMGSRIPVLLKNHRRKSTAGLNRILFLAAFLGNVFYCLGVLINPRAWSDLPPSGEHGWVGENGSRRREWLGLVAPFVLGAAGMAFLDGCIGLQFFYYPHHENLENDFGEQAVPYAPGENPQGV